MQKVYSRINWENDPSTNTPINEDNLNKMDYALDQIDKRVVDLYGYQDRVAQSEENAKQSEINAKESEENAKESELKAKEYMEQAFSGTPEGYAALIEQVDSIDIKVSSDTTLYKTAPGGYRLTDLVGATEQNGEPTPTTPIAIENTFDVVKMIQGGWDVSTGAYLSSNNYVCCKHPIPCKQGDTIDIEYDGVVTVIRALYYNNETFVSSKSIGESKFNSTVPDGVNNFKFIINNSNGLPIDSIGKITLTVNGKYVGQIVTKLGVEMAQGYLNATTGVLTNDSNNVSSKHPFPCKPNDVININTGVSLSRRIVFFGNGSVISSVNSSGLVTSFSATVPSGADSFKYSVGNTSAITPQIADKITLTINGVGEKVATFYLTEQLRKGDVLEKVDGVWRVERNRAVIVFDGSGDEEWSISASVNAPYIIIIPNCSKSMGELPDLVCSHYPTVAIHDTWANYDYVISLMVGSSGAPCFRDISVSSLTEFKSKLQSNPITLEYPLDTPTYETLDTASQIALNSLETFEGITYLEVDSKIPPTSISGEYGTSQVGAYTLKGLLNSESNAVKIEDAITTMLLIGAQ